MSGVARDTLHGASSTFTLHCRGEVRLYCGDADCTPKSKKGRALLAILAAEQRPLSRVRIIDLLWSDRQEEQARASLRTLLADLRSQFNSGFDDLFVVDRERIALGAGVRTDLTDPSLARPAGELFEGLDHIDPELDEWLRLEREKWAHESSSMRQAASTSAPVRNAAPQWAIAAVLLLAIAAAALFYWRPWAAPQRPVVAVLKFKDFTRQNELLADGLAEELRLGLAHNPGIDVIGRASSEEASIAGSTSPVAPQLSATHFVEGSLRLLGRELRLNLRVVETDSGRTIWNGAARAIGGVASDTNVLAGQIAGVLTDVLSNHAPPRTLTADDGAYAAVFAARAAIAGGDTEVIAAQRGVLQEVVRAHPDFVPALVALSRATMSASDHPFMRGPIPLAQARRDAAFYARRAIQLAPRYASAYDALAGAYRDMDPALPLLRKALSLSPGLPAAHRRLAWELEQNSDFSGALRHWRAAARLDPLSMSSNFQLMRALDFSGDKVELRRVGSEFAARLSNPEHRWMLDAVRAGFEADWSRFVTSTIRAERLDPEDPYTHRNFFLVLKFLFSSEAARPYAGDPESYSALLLDGRMDTVVRKMLSEPDEFFRLNFETAEVAERLARSGRLREFIRAYDQALRAKFPITPSETGLVFDFLVLGLREQGRTAEAERVLAQTEAELNSTKGLRAGYIDASAAFSEILRGRREQAVRRLEQAYGREWSLGLMNDGRPAWAAYTFHSIQSEPRIARLRHRYEREMAREREEAIREMLAANLRPLRCRAIPRVCPKRSNNHVSGST